MTTMMYTSKTVVGKDKKPKHREQLTRIRKRIRPKPADEFDATEIEDLTNDQYFYDQLEKNKPSTESSAEIEHLHEPQVNPMHDVDLFHNSNGNKREKNRQKPIKVHENLANLEEQPVLIGGIKDDDVDFYGDYGEMVMPDKDVEMHETFEKNTKEAYMNTPVQYSYGEQPHGKKRRKTNCNKPNHRHHPRTQKYRPTTHKHYSPTNKHYPTQREQVYYPPILTHLPTAQIGKIPIATNAHAVPPPNHHNHKTVTMIQSPRKKKFERIMVTKKLTSPEELHAEIDKIFKGKNKHYGRHGQGKSHWEVRIMPQHYDEIDEQHSK